MRKSRNQQGLADPFRALQEAIQLQNSGRLKRAEGAYKALLKSHPKNFDALHFFGLFCAQQGNYKKAIQLLRSAGQIEPTSAEVHNNLGNALQSIHEFQAAIESHDRAIQIEADFPEAHYNLGMSHAAIGKYEDAIECYRRAIELRPEYVEALNNLGTALQVSSRYRESEGCFRRALVLEPGFAKARLNLGNTLGALARSDEAMECYQAVLVQHPGMPEALCNIGLLQAANHQFSLARDWFRQALDAAPTHAEAYFQLGNVDLIEHKRNDAIANFRRALDLRPRFLDARTSIAMTMLLTESYEAGWREYEWRIRAPEYASLRLSKIGLENVKPDFQDKRVALFCEQGLGDTIQFARYAKLIKDAGAVPTLFAPNVLHGLLGSLQLDLQILTSDEATEPFDHRVSLMSLPHVLGRPDPASAPTPPYLFAEPRRIEDWKARIGGEGLKIGISWQGNPKGIVDVGRSVPLRCFAALSNVPGVRFISLQKNDGVEQLDDIADELTVETLGSDFDDGTHAFLDTAAVMSNLDLIITSDTAIAHVAGALGQRVWVLLKQGADWRWGVERSETPWYPTMTLYRQPNPGDWDAVLKTVADDLMSIVQK